MLTSLPSLLIIPFILLGGKLTEKVDFVRILKIGLWLFAASGILYLISNKMWQLIVVSALLGIGSGLIIPSVHGVNLKILCGYLSGETIRIEFCHYQFYIGDSYCRDRISGGSQLAFAVFGLSAPVDFYSVGWSLKRSRSDAASNLLLSTAPFGQTAAADTGGSKYGIHIKHLLQIMLFYGVTTFIVWQSYSTFLS